MRGNRIVAIVCVTLLLAAGTASAGRAEEAFERLKAMEGTWTGSARGGHDPAESAQSGAVHVFRVSANGTVVMETMNPDTPHEMINMYHLDGDQLLLTHYCAGGNQPRMQLDAGRSSGDSLVFDFTGGTNLDPAKDMHIHAAHLTFEKDASLISRWQGWSGGEPAGEMVFHLKRED